MSNSMCFNSKAEIAFPIRLVRGSWRCRDGHQLWDKIVVGRSPALDELQYPREKHTSSSFINYELL